MKLLWVKTDFLHPTTRGGQIRSLEILRQLNKRHDVHYLALDDGRFPEGSARAGEYSGCHESIPHTAPPKRSLRFVGQLAKGLVSPLPVAVDRWRSEQMRTRIAELDRREAYDAIVCDFLFPGVNMPDMSRATLFQHNVEAAIWRRQAAHGRTPLHRAYFALQARRMEAFERDICRSARRVIAVSEADASLMEESYGLVKVPAVPTGVDIEYFATPPAARPEVDIVFVGSMDWMPNIDGSRWFVTEVLPLIRERVPSCSLAIVGRRPSPAVRAFAEADPLVHVTGTVPDVRPWLSGAKLSVVPLRIGGGTRLKIYEAMASRLAVVSTSVGAEGLDVSDGRTIRIADDPEAFAEACVELLDDRSMRQGLADAAWSVVSERYSWTAVAEVFERHLEE